MKEETKKTIDWIKKVIKDGETIHSIEESDYEANEQSAINLLDKIENLEKYLQLGGLIQDVNKKWCKHEDHVIIDDCGEFTEAVIKWDSDDRKFYYLLNNVFYPLQNIVFSKIEDQNEAAE